MKNIVVKMGLASLVASTLVMTGCTTPNGGYGMSNTTMSAIQGAAAGAAIGALAKSDGDRDDIAKGAAVGAVAGAAVGAVAGAASSNNQNQYSQYP